MDSAAAETNRHTAERKRATVLFADILGFTALSEKMGPEQAYLVVTECLKLLDELTPSGNNFQQQLRRVNCLQLLPSV